MDVVLEATQWKRQRCCCCNRRPQQPIARDNRSTTRRPPERRVETIERQPTWHLTTTDYNNGRDPSTGFPQAWRRCGTRSASSALS
mmetsp:Transcript_22988/g.50105  ORF Transcript_22988/g.50105 Transcript_22988/m.50105 type:complete len:86 (+) Transcript_22988:1008-1265(+)